MPRQGLSIATTPLPVEAALKRLGANICRARQRRALKQEDLARKAGVNVLTIRRVEHGNPTTSIATYFTALWALGLEREFADLASPDRDEEGKALEWARAPQRIRARRGGLDDNF